MPVVETEAMKGLWRLVLLRMLPAIAGGLWLGQAYRWLGPRGGFVAAVAGILGMIAQETCSFWYDRERRGKTDFEKLRKMKDADIDLSDIPELDDEFFKTAKTRKPKP